MLDQVKKFYALFKDLFLSMTLGNRIVAVLLIAMLLVSLGYLIVGSIKPTDPQSKVVWMYDGYRFDSNEKRAAEDALRKAGIADMQWIGDKLQVPSKRITEYTAVLADANVIAKNGDTRHETAKVYSAWQSAKVMDAQMIVSKEKDCAAVIKRFDGIAEASVITNKRPDWQRNVWARTQVCSAAVTIEAIHNKPLEDNTIAAIGRTVASAFGILDSRANITIVDAKHNRSYNGMGEETSGGQGEYIKHQRRYEDEWNKRIYSFLQPIDGMKVETSVQLTTYRSLNYFDVEHRKPTVLVDHTMDYLFHKESRDRFARPGQIAQFSRPLIDPSADTAAKDLTDEKKNEKETTNALPGRETKDEELPYIPERVFASIQYPREHLVQLWKQKNSGGEPTPEQIKTEEDLLTNSTKQTVAKLLEPYTDKKTPALSLVEVTYYDMIKREVKILTFLEEVQLFLQNNWQTLSLLGLVLAGLTVLYALTKPPKAEPIVIYEGLETPLEAIDARLKAKAEAEAKTEAEAVAVKAEKEAEIERTLDSFGSIRSLKDEIAELIAENPEAAAAVVRQWVGNAVLLETKT